MWCWSPGRMGSSGRRVPSIAGRGDAGSGGRARPIEYFWNVVDGGTMQTQIGYAYW